MTLRIPIRLDRPRSLLLDEQALHLCRHVFGVALEPSVMMQTELTLELTRQMIWCGLVVEDRRLKFEAICRMVTLENYETFHEAIAKAMVRGIGASYQPQ